ncbi:MAG: hypothetical protein GY820_39700 [Gammaproteobacteria bacterium]|nr:hypothetical protein [Gammaproteobacteria bacterium]
MSEELATVEVCRGLSEEKGLELAGRFNPFATETRELVARADEITVADEDDVESMEAARAVRLGLRRIRCDAETVRKDLKENSLREGKAIDGMANIIKAMIVPAEKRLQDQEDFVKLAREKRIRERTEKRSEQLRPYVEDVTLFAVGAMTEDGFDQLLDSSHAAHAARLKAEKEAEEKAAAEAKRRAEEEERLRAENESLRKKEAKTAKEAKRLREEKVEREEEQRKTDAVIEEMCRESDEEKARAEAAPDAEKLDAFAAEIAKLTPPTMVGEFAELPMQRVRNHLNGAHAELLKAARAIRERGEK